MDSIDITDSTFSLDVPEINEVISTATNVMSGDSTMYIYIGIAILVIIGIYVFYNFLNFNQNKKSEQYNNDCDGGFCTMNQNIRQI